MQSNRGNFMDLVSSYAHHIIDNEIVQDVFWCAVVCGLIYSCLILITN